jgi:hypothetical protein
MADEADPELPPIEGVDSETRELLGLFDTPAFVRRGNELDLSIRRLHERCQRERMARLDMAHLRLRQWAAACNGPHGWPGVFVEPIDHLWHATGAPDPVWGQDLASLRHRRAIARDLVASLERFNRRWQAFLDELPLARVNRLVADYNHNYLIEKECLMRSARLAARHFQPRLPITVADLLGVHPCLSIPLRVK